MRDLRSEPFVSFVTPVYNGARYLSECIESVLTQEYANWEYVILDNNSHDGSREIIERYARQDRRIRVFRNEVVLPIMANWNAALTRISRESRYCKVVHADDRLFPRCTWAMVDLAERHPSIGMVGAYSLWGNRVKCDGLTLDQTAIDGRQLARLTLLGQIWPFLSPSSLLIRADLIRGAGEFYPTPELHADVAACYETLHIADFGFVHEVLTYIRRHDGSVTEKEALPLRRMKWSNLALFVQYGPQFLEPDEFKKRLAALMHHYHTFLAQSVLELYSKDFFRFHREGLRKLGMALGPMQLAGAVLRECGRQPTASVRRLRKALRSRKNAKRERSDVLPCPTTQASRSQTIPPRAPVVAHERPTACLVDTDPVTREAGDLAKYGNEGLKLFAPKTSGGSGGQ